MQIEIEGPGHQLFACNKFGHIASKCPNQGDQSTAYGVNSHKKDRKTNLRLKNPHRTSSKIIN